MEAKIYQRLQTLDITDSLLSKAGLDHLVRNDSVLASMLIKYQEYASEYGLPTANLQQLYRLPQTNLLSASLPNAPDIPGMPLDNPSLQGFRTLEGLGDFQEFGTLEEASQLRQSKNIDEAIDQQAGKIDELAYLEKQNQAIDAMENELDNMADPELLKKQAMAKSKVLANHAVLENLDKAQIPTKTIKKFQNKYRQFNSANAMASGKEDPLKYKPGQRFVYGTNFQMNPGMPVSVDLSPLFGYRINTLWTLGLGGTVRYSLDPKEDFRPPDRTNVVYGYRLFSQCRAIKSIYVHTELEAINKPLKETRFWKTQALAGIGKEFTISKSIKGNVSVLYNFLHDDKSPYMKPVVFRFGFVRKKD